MGSFRTRVFILSTVLSFAVVSSVMLVSFLVVTSRMEEAAQSEASRLARAGSSIARRLVTRSLLEAHGEGLTGEARRQAAMASFSHALPQEFGPGSGLLDGEIAVYASPGSERGRTTPVFDTGRSALVGDDSSREVSARDGKTIERHIRGQSLVGKVFGKSDLGVYIVHVPFEVPDGSRYVLDAVYQPYREEVIIDRVRPTMLLVSATAVLVTILFMQATLNWVLRLVTNLRVAAESIGGGDLDVRLPDEGTSEVAELARVINGLIERLRRRSEAQTRFIADASHELATPVAGIRGYVNILRGWGADDPVVREEAVAAIDRESRRMARLTTQLLEMIRSEEVLELHSVRHDINGVVRSVLEQAAVRYPEKRLEFVGPDPGQLVVFGDPERVEDVLYILVDNAAKYTGDGGRVSVQTYRRKGDVVIEVSDNGPGIPPEDLPSIFDRFYRSDLSRSNATGGFGLGLSIAKRIVDTSGGLIDVRSHPGKGTTFSIRLPRGRD